MDVDQARQLVASVQTGGAENVQRDVVTIAARGGVHGTRDVISGRLVVGYGGIDGLEGVMGGQDELQQWRG